MLRVAYFIFFPIFIILFNFPFSDVCSLYRQDQEVCAAILCALIPAISCLGRTAPESEQEDEMAHLRGALLQVMSGFW